MSKLREARELLQNGAKLTAGEYEMGGCFCSVGALREAHGFDSYGAQPDAVAYREDVRRLAYAVRASEGLDPADNYGMLPITIVTEWNDAQFAAEGWDMDETPLDPGEYTAAKAKILAVWDAAIAELDKEEKANA